MVEEMRRYAIRFLSRQSKNFSLKKWRQINNPNYTKLLTLPNGDSRFLNVLLRGREGQCNRYGSFKVFFGFGILEEIEKAWKSVGIDAKLDYSGYPNEYYLNGKQITCDQAYDHAQQVVGKTLRRYDYNY